MMASHKKPGRACPCGRDGVIFLATQSHVALRTWNPPGHKVLFARMPGIGPTLLHFLSPLPGSRSQPSDQPTEFIDGFWKHLFWHLLANIFSRA